MLKLELLKYLSKLELMELVIDLNIRIAELEKEQIELEKEQIEAKLEELNK